MSKGCGIAVQKRGHESFERMLHRFNKRIEKEGIREVMVENMHYIKPSDKRRRKRRSNRYWRTKGVIF